MLPISVYVLALVVVALKWFCICFRHSTTNQIVRWSRYKRQMCFSPSLSTNHYKCLVYVRVCTTTHVHPAETSALRVCRKLKTRAIKTTGIWICYFCGTYVQMCGGFFKYLVLEQWIQKELLKCERHRKYKSESYSQMLNNFEIGPIVNTIDSWSILLPSCYEFLFPIPVKCYWILINKFDLLPIFINIGPITINLRSSPIDLWSILIDI